MELTLEAPLFYYVNLNTSLPHACPLSNITLLNETMLINSLVFYYRVEQTINVIINSYYFLCFFFFYRYGFKDNKIVDLYKLINKKRITPNSVAYYVFINSVVSRYFFVCFNKSTKLISILYSRI